MSFIDLVYKNVIDRYAFKNMYAFLMCTLIYKYT